MILNIDLKKTIEDITSKNNYEFSHNDELFFRRIYADGIDKYKERLKSISFVNNEDVLDAGCGYGQWSLALADLNKNVIACDIAKNRLNFLDDLISNLSINNLFLKQSGIDNLPFVDNSFDIVFCYQVLQLTPWRKSISELFRVLKPGGKIYLTTNDIGWYVNLWREPYNQADDYDPKEVAAKSFLDTLNYERNKKINSKMNLIIEKSEIIMEMKKLGFINIEASDEGNLKSKSYKKNPLPFFKKKFQELPTVYEVLGEKNYTK